MSSQSERPAIDSARHTQRDLYFPRQRWRHCRVGATPALAQGFRWVADPLAATPRSPATRGRGTSRRALCDRPPARAPPPLFKGGPGGPALRCSRQNSPFEAPRSPSVHPSHIFHKKIDQHTGRNNGPRAKISASIAPSPVRAPPSGVLDPPLTSPRCPKNSSIELPGFSCVSTTPSLTATSDFAISKLASFVTFFFSPSAGTSPFSSAGTHTSSSPPFFSVSRRCFQNARMLASSRRFHANALRSSPWPYCKSSRTRLATRSASYSSAYCRCTSSLASSRFTSWSIKLSSVSLALAVSLTSSSSGSRDLICLTSSFYSRAVVSAFKSWYAFLRPNGKTAKLPR